MPQLGETVIEGTILKWLKKEGESIDVDEPLFEISTDKVDTEVPSPAGGTVSKILVPEGETVSVGTELAQIDEGSANGEARSVDRSPEGDGGQAAQDGEQPSETRAGGEASGEGGSGSEAQASSGSSEQRTSAPTQERPSGPGGPGRPLIASSPSSSLRRRPRPWSPRPPSGWR